MVMLSFSFRTVLCCFYKFQYQKAEFVQQKEFDQTLCNSKMCSLDFILMPYNFHYYRRQWKESVLTMLHWMFVMYTVYTLNIVTMSVLTIYNLCLFPSYFLSFFPSHCFFMQKKFKIDFVHFLSVKINQRYFDIQGQLLK